MKFLSSFLLFFAFLFSAHIAWSQRPAHTFAELRTKVQSGDVIEVIDLRGRKLKGRISGLSIASLRLAIRGSTRELREPEIVEIRRRRPEDKWNGVKLGAGIGAAAGLVTTVGVCSSRGGCAGGAPATILLGFTGAGAGTGALIDFLIRKTDRVYEAAGRRETRALKVEPILGKHERGFRLSLRF